MSKIRKTIVGAVVVLACGLSALAGTAFAVGQFSDVPESHPFFDDIEWMADSGISEGYDDGTFKPSAPVTRQAMSAFMHRGNTQEIVFQTELFTSENIATVEVSCPEGTAVVSGGGSANGVNLMLTDSTPLADGSGWTASFETDDGGDASFSATATAICGAVDNG
jgi:hypothetical protein